MEQEVKYSPFHRRFLPVFLCKPEYNRNKTKVIGWQFTCPYCHKTHSHSPYEGPREAHCLKRTSPYNKTGYYLKLNADVETKIHYIEASKICPCEEDTECTFKEHIVCSGNVFDCPHKVSEKYQLCLL